LVELELQIARLQCSLRQNSAHGFDEILGAQFRRGSVDRDAHRWQAGLLPRSGLKTTFAQDPAADRRDEATLFSDWHELRRAHEPALRVTPADQGFSPDDGAIFKIQLWLVMQQKLLAF